MAVCPNRVIGWLSYHLPVIFSVNIPITAPFRQGYTQKIHKINITDFSEDILNSDLIKHAHTTASLLSCKYFNTLCNILDKHIPIKRKETPLHPDKGFLNTDILLSKCFKRKYDRVWCRDNSAINQSRYRAAGYHYNFLLVRSKCRHYCRAIPENNGNPKALWITFKRILNKSSTIILLDHISPTGLANTFGHIFSDKIMKIRVGYSHRHQSLLLDQETSTAPYPL